MPSFVENVNKLANSIPDDFGSIISDIQSSISSLDSGKVDKVEGMVLSENSYTTTEKEKLSSLSNYTHPTKHHVSILDGSENPSKFVKTDAIGGVGFGDITWSDIQGKPSSFNPNVHQHTLSEISDAILKADKTYVDSGLATKANVTDVNTALALKADLSVVATDAELQSAIITLQPLSQKGQANGYVPLDAAGKIPNSYLNSLSTIDVYTANSQANMLLLSNVNVGDQCIRTDLSSNNLFILTQTPATDFNNWKQINTSASVMSVNGQTGVVNVSKSDVGLGNVDNTSDATKNVLSATKLTASRTISLSGDATGSASFDGSANASIPVVIADNSHNHTLANISDFPSAVSAVELGYLDGVTSNIQTQLDTKPSTLKTINGTSIVGSGDIVVGVGDMYKSTYDTTNNGIVDRAETADKLATARTIGGVSFDGTANINLPGVNTTGNQNTTGNAATATIANALNSSNEYTGVGFTANTGVLRVQNWAGVPTNGVTYYGNANSYIYKAGPTWEIRNEQSGFTNTLNTGGAIVTQDGRTWSINATSSSALVGDETDWASFRSRSVANMLGWKNYGNGHCIFDASASTAPNGVAVNNTNAGVPWSPALPTLMGWNGGQTYGVRVDSARVADSATTATTATTLTTFVPGGLTEVGRYFDFHGSTAASDYDVRLDAGVTGTTGGGTLTITAGGGLVCSGNVTAYSDSRLKENIETIDNALEKTLNMRGVYYNRIDDEKKRRKLGVIAQEVQAIIPEVVLTNEETGTLSVDYGNIVGLLIEAIKEQQKQIDELTALVKGA